MAKSDLETIGGYAFILGVIIAIIAGLFPMEGWAVWTPLVLVILGLIVGFLNITDKEINSFLIAGISLLAAGTAGLGIIPTVGAYLASMLLNIGAFVAPAVVIVALKAVYSIAHKAK
ncbi:hypothetical protein HZB89_02310 [archaeon]|nr:hypothetical protein [archaeon]